LGGSRFRFEKPFENLHTLAAGDEAIIVTEFGRFTYRVAEVHVAVPGSGQ
jgi:sortase (surface protein transpeptidase)